MAARPTSRTLARQRPGTSTPVRDYTGGRPAFVIEWDVRPAYDFLFSLAPDAGTTDDLPAEDRRWLKAARAALPATTQATLDGVLRDELTVHLGGFLVTHPEIHGAADVAPAMREAGAPAVLRWLYAEHAASQPGLAEAVDRALAGDRAAAAELRATVDETKHRSKLDVLDAPEAAFERLLAIIEGWAPAFAEIEARVAAILRRDYDLRTGDRETLVGSDLVERTTGGVRIVPEATVRRVILAPSYFSRPFNFLLAGEDWRFAAYPVADAALDLDPLSPPAAVLRLHRALGDATRLRMLKLLSEKDLYATELAELLELSKPTVTHHLAQLRAAGLVTAIEAGAVIYYHLRRDRLESATGDLRAFLAG
jgi:DNA-binding transcriptional ArsR family regulator